MEWGIVDCRHRNPWRAREPSSELRIEPTQALPSRSFRNPGSARLRLATAWQAIRDCNCSLPQSMIAKHQRGHRFHDRHRSGKNARIMASTRNELSLLARTGHGLLFVGDRSCRLKRDTKINLLSITDAALRAAGIVCCRANSPAAHFKWIVMLRAPHPRRGKTGTNLESLRRRYAQHRFRQIRIALVKNRFTKSRRNAAHHAFNNATNRLTFVAHLFAPRPPFIRRQ